jgi:hypothetical protein
MTIFSVHCRVPRSEMGGSGQAKAGTPQQKAGPETGMQRKGMLLIAIHQTAMHQEATA